MENIEEVYIDSAKRLRKSLPKFIVLISSALLIWIFGMVVFIPLTEGVRVLDIDTSRLVNLIIIFSLVLLIVLSFGEIKNISYACAGFVAYYIGSERAKITDQRLLRLRRSFMNLADVLLASFFFILFKPLLEQLHSALAGIVLIILIIWAIIALVSVAMVLGSEIEEAAIKFTEILEKRVKKKTKRK